MELWQWHGVLCLRILLATLLGGLIGLERVLHFKDAGIRTHSVIACASATFMILSMFAYGDVPFETDTSILATQIVYGFAFMGAGIIIKDKYRVIAGLRSATGLWATAAIGMACGQGMYLLAVIGAAAILVLQTLFFHGKLNGTDFVLRKIKVTFVDSPELRAFWAQKRAEFDIRPYSTRFKRNGAYTEMTMRVRMTRDLTLEDVLDIYDERNDIVRISL